ncbi:MAG: RNA-directed DNA polymerase [Alphaproteobacteria bacterium]|nr:RNA-directed DNA polymerase [Alphaproteobacteria bacterium]
MTSLWSDFISHENFALALKNATRGRKTKPSIAHFLKNADENLENLRQLVIAGGFKTSPYRTMEITDPKRRTIYILPFCPDRLLHHALMNILAPIWEAGFIRDSYACITGRGLHSASRRTMQFVRRNQYVLKCDIRKFYPSIDHNIMYEIVKKSLPPGNENILAILHDIIYSTAGGKNLPIGNLCSQWMGNLYLHEMDIYIKHELRVRDYLRYSDDFCLFSNDNAQLRGWRDKIREFLAARLGLIFSKAEIFPVSNGLDFVGYRHFKDFVLLRKRTLKKIKSRMLEIGEMKNIAPANAERIRGQVAAAHGWLKFACSYNLRKKLRFETLKKKVGIIVSS